MEYGALSILEQKLNDVSLNLDDRRVKEAYLLKELKEIRESIEYETKLAVDLKNAISTLNSVEEPEENLPA